MRLQSKVCGDVDLSMSFIEHFRYIKNRYIFINISNIKRLIILYIHWYQLKYIYKILSLIKIRTYNSRIYVQVFYQLSMFEYDNLFQIIKLLNI